MKYTHPIAVAFLAIAFAGCGPEAPKSPGEEAFFEANTKTISYKDSIAFGNTSKGESIAKAFSETMGEKQKLMFSGGGEIQAMTMGNFLTYCQLAPDAVVIMSTVPGMKDYKGEVREALADLAWTTAQQVTSHLSPETALVVALKGSVLYGPVWSGKVSGPPESKSKGLDAMKPYYSVFAEQIEQGAAANP